MVRSTQAFVVLVVAFSLQTFIATPLGAQSMPAVPAAPHPDSAFSVAVAQKVTGLVAAVLLDAHFREALAAEHPDEWLAISRVGNTLGRGMDAAFILGAAYGATRIAGLEQASTPIGRTLAGLLTAGSVNAILKVSVGRARPGRDVDGDHFRPFNFQDRWQSFPSGHAVTAFAIAAAVSEQADSPWVTGATFGAASLVGWSRVHEDRHWTSDVVAGALIGTLTSGATVRWLQSRADPASRSSSSDSNLDRQIMIVPTPAGIAVSISTR